MLKNFFQNSSKILIFFKFQLKKIFFKIRQFFMILNYLKKNFFQKTINFNDFKLFKKKIFFKKRQFFMILNY